jgi:hypothetical protein
LEEHFNGSTKDDPKWNEANLILLSKDKTPIPEITRIRPIAAYSPLSKCREAIIDVVSEDILWSQIQNN